MTSKIKRCEDNIQIGDMAMDCLVGYYGKVQAEQLLLRQQLAALNKNSKSSQHEDLSKAAATYKTSSMRFGLLILEGERVKSNIRDYGLQFFTPEDYNQPETTGMSPEDYLNSVQCFSVPSNVVKDMATEVGGIVDDLKQTKVVLDRNQLQSQQLAASTQNLGGLAPVLPSPAASPSPSGVVSAAKQEQGGEGNHSGISGELTRKDAMQPPADTGRSEHEEILVSYRGSGDLGPEAPKATGPEPSKMGGIVEALTHSPELTNPSQPLEREEIKEKAKRVLAGAAVGTQGSAESQEPVKLRPANDPLKPGERVFFARRPASSSAEVQLVECEWVGNQENLKDAHLKCVDGEIVPLDGRSGGAVLDRRGQLVPAGASPGK